MALTVTSASGAIGLNDRRIKLTAFTNPAVSSIGPDTYALVDGEYMLITDTTNSPTVDVARGMFGTAACAHGTLAPIVYGLASDFTQNASTNGVAGSPVSSIGADNTNYTAPVVDAIVYLDKATALAVTLNGPNKDQTNTIKFVSLTAAAHVITYTAGFYQNTTSSDLATFPSTSGAVFTMCAKNGVWNAQANFSSNGVTIG